MTELVFIRPWWLAAIPAGLALVWWRCRHWDWRRRSLGGRAGGEGR